MSGFFPASQKQEYNGCATMFKYSVLQFVNSLLYNLLCKFDFKGDFYCCWLQGSKSRIAKDQDHVGMQCLFLWHQHFVSLTFLSATCKSFDVSKSHSFFFIYYFLFAFVLLFFWTNLVKTL